MAVVRRSFARSPAAAAGGFKAPSSPKGVWCTSGCYPGCCFNEPGGQICCVTSGNTHVCNSKCFAYKWPGQKPALKGGQLAAAQARQQNNRRRIGSMPGGNSPGR